MRLYYLGGGPIALYAVPLAVLVPISVVNFKNSPEKPMDLKYHVVEKHSAPI